MRRFILTLLALCAPTCALAQGSFTSVTGIVQDPLANIYQNGTFSINFFDPGTSGKQPLLPGNQPFQTQFSGSLDSFGLFNVSLADNGVIASASGATGTSWQFFMCANPGILRLTTSNAIPCFSYSTPIICASNTPTTCSASTINITAQLKAVAAYLPIVNGTAAAKPILPYNPIQYVSQNGSDTNDGLSWGTSKATVYAALLALPGGGAGFAGSGTVYVGPNASANPTSGAGIWIMSSLDPNYSSPPAGWLKCSSCAVNVIGDGTNTPGYSWRSIFVPMTAGSTADRNHPSVWLSGLNHNFDILNMSFSGSQRPIVVGECSNHDRSGTCLSFGGLLDRVDVNVTVVNASSGPGIDLAAATFQEIRNGSCTGSTGAVVTYTADNAACILQVGGSLRLSNEELFHGGVKVLGLGSNPGQFGTYAYDVDEYGDNVNTQPPAVWFTNYTQLADSVLQNITQQYGNSAIGWIRVEAPTTPQFGPTVVGVAGTVVVGPATILASVPYYYVQQSNKAVSNRQVGFINGYMFGETNVARRIGSLLPTRFLNKAASNAANWTSAGNTITLAQADPFGGTGAAKFHTVAVGSQAALLGSATAYTPAIGDWIVAGVWAKGSLPGGVILVSPGVTFSTQSTWVGVDIGDGNEWAWQYIAYKVAANAAATTLQINHAYLSSGDVTLYGPVLYVLPAASVSDDEALWFANSASSIDTTCAVGNICTVSGHPLQVPGLTAGNCVQASTGGVLTTTSASCGIGGGSLLSSVNTTPVTVNANVTTTQTLQAAQSPVPAGAMNTLGKTMRITSAGVFNPVNNTETTIFAFNPGGGGNAVFYPYVATTNGSNIAWSITADCTTTTTGVAGVLTCIANLSIGNVVSGAGAPTFNSGLTASGGTFSGVDLTGTLTPAFFVSFNSASASNTAAGNYLLVEQLN